MLEKVGFKNFLALRDVELTLEPFTVIVGPNASGKSSILEGIRRIVGLRGVPVDFLGVEFRPQAQNLIIQEMQSLESKNLQPLPISFSYKFENSDDFQIDFSQVSHNYSLKINGLSVRRELEVRDAHNFPVISKMTSKIITFSRNDAARASYSENLSPVLEPTGLGLATICSYTQSLQPEKFAWIQAKMREIIPNFQKFRIEPARVAAKDWFNVTDPEQLLEDILARRFGTGQQLLFDFEKSSNVAVKFVSEGTLFALTVLVTVAISQNDTVILIDDIERGLHPKAVKDLIRVLREIQAITSGLQIIATSHSPYVLHELEPKEVRVTTFDPELGTLVAPLEAYPNFEQWRESMTPGEFWSFVGEDWVKELFLEKARA